jgi:hypothetical protein
MLALAQTYFPTLLHKQHLIMQSAALRMLSWCGCCCLQEALPNPSISNVELVPQLQDWADEAGDAERCKLFSKKAARDAFAARVIQVGLAIFCTARVRGLSAGQLPVQARTLQDVQACHKTWLACLNMCCCSACYIYIAKATGVSWHSIRHPFHCCLVLLAA